MKVLWITNIVFPEAQALLNGEDELTASGGWMLGAANALIQHQDIELVVAAPAPPVEDLKALYGKIINYYLFPLGNGNLKKNDEYRKYWRQIHDAVNPDVVHIHGTEFSHGLAYIDECGADNVVVSIQGLTSEIAKYYSLGLSKWDILKNITIGDLFRGSVFRDVAKYRERGKMEIELLKKVNHIIGRTTFDKAHVWAINPDAHYHFCNEILREEFYTGQWKYSECCSHRIFFSQANCPLKGLHFFLEALRFVTVKYPDVIVHIAGNDITTCKPSLRGIYAYSGYGKLIRRLIKKYKLQHNVVFTGPLSSSQMKAEFLAANVFVCSSTIENSCNSLAEAQILGVPSISSYVGGIPDMVPNENCGYLYRCEDVASLAYLICKVFEISSCFDSIQVKEIARKRHDPTINTKQLLSIYKSLTYDF